MRAREFYTALMIAGTRWDENGNDIVTPDWDDEEDMGGG